MPTRESTATWSGPIGDGTGHMRLGSGAWEGAFDVPSRFEDGDGSNPEELLGAAHAGCFSMQLSGLLTRAGHEVRSIETSAAVTVEKQEAGWKIVSIALTTRGDVDADADTFQEIATKAKETCPVSMALGAVPEITLDAALA
jgi:osmotically inducible protein OsmC